ncbi:glutathione S-transferase N-terminal domain-containing protein [Natronorarus salvus]|uniref:glutathione S-transferase N-terminal domain-containing protein n=1 Tax=Natronorarus salvus TaxID=3117733 RepID=UPI002F26C011
MLELYQSEDCPHSAEVRERMTDLGLSYVVHNPRTAAGEERNGQALDELETIGGKDEIPFLVDTTREETRYDSEEIVQYLEDHYGDGR